MSIKFAKLPFLFSNQNFLKDVDHLPSKKTRGKSIKLKPSIKDDIIFRIGNKMKQTLNRRKDYEKKVRNILNKNINKDTHRAQENFYSMIINNILSDKSHRIRTKFLEMHLETNLYEILSKFYKRNDSYDKLKFLNNVYANNIIYFPNYFINQNVYYIMEKYLEAKENLFIKIAADNKRRKIMLHLTNVKKRNRFQDFSSKILESFSEDNEINLENNLKNLNDESFDYSKINLNDSSFKVQKLIYELNKNLYKKKKKKKVVFLKNYEKIKTKNYDVAITKFNNNLRMKRQATLSRPVGFNKNMIMQQLYLNDFLAKRFEYYKTKGNNHKINENDLNLENFSNLDYNIKSYLSRNQIITINNNNDLHHSEKENYFKPTDLFIYDYFKEKNLNRKMKIKKTIINSIQEYKTLKTQKIVSFLKKKENLMIKGFSLSSSRKKLKNFVQKDGFTTEVTQIKDVLKKLKNKKTLKLGGINTFTENKEQKRNTEYIPSKNLFYRNNDRYINTESLTERIRMNIKKLLKKKKFSNSISVLFKKKQ